MSLSAERAAGAPNELSRTRRRVLLWSILGVGGALRSFRLAWGLPHFIFNDSTLYFVAPAARAAAVGDWVLDRFTHPPVYPYLLSALVTAWARLSGNEVHLAGAGSAADLARIALLQRFVTVLVATLTIAAVYLLAKRLLGTRGALWAAAFFALCPVHILESHRVNADAPMLLFAVLSAHQAVIASQRGNLPHLWASFALASLAGASKYTGLFAGTLPIWVVLRWPGAGWRDRGALMVRGGLVALLAFVVFMSPVALAWDRFATNVADLFYAVFFLGSPGKDLMGDSWVYAPYLYLTFVGLPFLVGWPIFVAAIAGAVAMARERRQALSLVAAAALPFFLVQGGAETATARYYLPLAPYLAVSAAAAMCWTRERSTRAANALGCAVLGYSLVFAGSQVGRIGGAPQAAIGAAIEGLAETKRANAPAGQAPARSRLVVAYPSWAAVKYDALWPYINTADTRLRFFPPAMRFSTDPVDPLAPLDEWHGWIENLQIDAIVITSSWEYLGSRNSFTLREQIFYDSLTGGDLGLRKVADESTRFFTQSWYDWADPTLDTVWTAGIGGYKLYVTNTLAERWRASGRLSQP